MDTPEIPEAVRALVKANKPAIAIAVRLKPDSLPRESPVFVSVEVGSTNYDDIAIMLAAIKTVYLQIVQQVAESGGIPEQEFHNTIAEHVNKGWSGGEWT